MSAEGGQPALALRGYVKSLTTLRHAEPGLRRPGGRWAITTTNNADTPRTVEVTLADDAPGDVWRAVLAQADVTVPNRRLRLELPALGAQVLLAGR